ncbi:Alpha/Beta hydrolase protein [Aspergillus heterothallicus]
MMLALPSTLWALASWQSGPSPPLATPATPGETAFASQAGLPAFSLQLGQDTASVCNSSTPGTAGSIISDDGHGGNSSMFFWFFESKNDPASDPVILWMTGGPGASSVGYGNLMELGPCRIAPEGGYTVPNEFGWNANATILFVDQPVDVGYSRGKHIPRGLTESSAAMDRFLRQFMTAFPALASRDFYIAGESYGGSWIPALAATILESQADGNTLEVQGSSSGGASSLNPPPSQPTINLKGVMIGNGLIRRSIQNLGFFETACSGPESLLDSAECRHWAPRAMWCEKNLAICESEGMKSPSCKEAEDKCSAIGQVITGEKHRNPYDIRLKCDDPEACYKEMQAIDEFLNQDAVKEALGVPLTERFQGISLNVFKQWEELGDLWRASDGYVNYLLESSIRVLIYVGDKDLYCNAAGMRQLVDHGLDWHGQPFIRFRELVPWYVEAKVAGRWKAYEPLTYAEIADAGHLAPFDRPLESLSLINAWIQGRMPAM